MEALGTRMPVLKTERYNGSLNEIRIDVICGLSPAFFFQQPLTDFHSCEVAFVKCCEEERSIKLPLQTLNSLHVSICEVFTFCNVLHESKPSKRKLLRVRITD